MKKNLMMKLLGVVMVSGFLSACSGTIVVDNSDPYYHAWYDVYGSYCGTGYPTSGCNFYSSGAKITMTDDPYYSSGIHLYNDVWTYTDSYGYRRTFSGYAWLSSSGILYDSSGRALNEMDQDALETADVLSQAASKEAAVQQAVGKALAQKYALAEDKGLEISQALQDWAKIGKDRARTGSDVARFSKRLYGVDVNKVSGAIQKALVDRSQAPLDDLNVDVAAHWGTSPEVSKQILKGWYKDEVAAYGIR